MKTLIMGLLFTLSCQAVQYTYNIGGDTDLVDGGYANVVAASPNGVVLVGGNMSGIYRSEDHGITWEPANRGLFHAAQASVAALEFHKEDPNIVYAGLGFGIFNKTITGLYASVDGGKTWGMLHNAFPLHFIGGLSGDLTGIPGNNLESTGRLIVSDPTATDDYLYVGTFSNGLYRLTNNGYPVRIGLQGSFIRGLGFYRDEASAVLWIATCNNGLWRGKVSGTGPITAIEQIIPDIQAEEVLVMNKFTVYVTCQDPVSGNRIIRTKTGWGTTPVFQTISTPSLPSLPNETGTANRYHALTGYMNGTNHILYAGLLAADPCLNRNNVSLVKATSAQTTPVWVGKFFQNSSNPSSIITGTTDLTHWLLTSPVDSCRPGAANYCISQIAMGANNSTVFVCGHSGVYRSTDWGQTWAPSALGRLARELMDVAVDPKDDQRVMAAGADYGIHYSSNAMIRTMAVQPSALPGVFSSREVFWDTTYTPSRAIAVSCGHEGVAGTELYYSDTPESQEGWTSMNFNSQLNGTSNRIIAASFNRAMSTNMILVAVDSFGSPAKAGIWRSLNYGTTWTKGICTDPLMNGSSVIRIRGMSFEQINWAILIFDRDNGLFRSRDCGATWQKIWSVTAEADYYKGYITTAGTTLYLAENGNVWKLTNAHLGTSVESGAITKTLIGSFGSGLGAIKARPNDGTLYAIVNATDSIETHRLLYYTGTGTNWVDTANDWFKNTFPHCTGGIEFAPDDSKIYIPTRGNGVLLGILTP